MPRRCRAPRSARCCATRCAAFSPSTGRPSRRSPAAASRRRSPGSGPGSPSRGWPASAASRPKAACASWRWRWRSWAGPPARRRSSAPASSTWPSPATTPPHPAKDLLAQLHAGSARVCWSFGELDPSAGASELTWSGDRLSGTLRFVDGAAAATHLVVARSGGRPGLAIVALHATRATTAAGSSPPAPSVPTAGPRSSWPTCRRRSCRSTTHCWPTCCASPASPSSPAPTARPAAPSRWRSTTPGSASSSASRSAASRRSSTSSRTT